ncbi:MAG: alanine racemase [Pseudomonadota bacterium]|jgi:alanine racemase
MSRPIQARINLSALTHNLGVARRHAPNSRLMAVIKASGYGHGMLRTAKALRDAEGFAVLSLDEALALREAGFRQTILLLEGFFSPDELPAIAEYGLATLIHCDEQLDMLVRAGLPSRVEVFLKLNTGMNRLGFAAEAFPAALRRLRSCQGVGKITLMTHFAAADEAQGVAEQLSRFREAVAGLELPVSLANSAAILRYPETHADWARPGIMLYGASPFANRSAADFGLEPAMTLTSEIIAVQHLAPGEMLGYGGAFRAEAPVRAGIVACGYADGYPRHAPTGTPILVDGARTRTLGRVSMDMLFVDITGLPAAGIGSPVTLWGKGMPVEEVAHAAGTISYELLCALAPRVPIAES